MKKFVMLITVAVGLMQTSCNRKLLDYESDDVRVEIAEGEEWLHDYEAFRDWSYTNGYDENAKYGKCSLDRIDLNGNYCPENCRWVDYKVQANNASYNRLLTLNGETHTLSQWAEITKIPYDRIKQRLHRGYTDEEALTLPIGGKRGNVVRSTSCA